ncbi:MAG: hypothetical protein ACLSB9_15685 [Hydrogeniiclostridium mannosilyticum]
MGVARLCGCVSAIKRAAPEMAVVDSGLSYLRQFSANQAAGLVESGAADLAGFGRMAFAYPDFAADILREGRLKPEKCCLACSKCTELMRAGSTPGCVVRTARFMHRCTAACCKSRDKGNFTEEPLKGLNGGS